jgi:hypothetical protein
MRGLVFISLVGLVGLGISADAQAWGAKGHRIVGHLARELLTADVKAEIRRIMSSDELATFALFMDQHKDHLEHRHPGSRAWHYDDVPVCDTQTHEE